MKLALIILVTMATTPAWAVDNQTCMNMGAPAYSQEQSGGHIDGAPFIRAALASGLTTRDIRSCLIKATAEYAKLKVHNTTSIDPEVLRKTTRDLYTALNSFGPAGNTAVAKSGQDASR